MDTTAELKVALVHHWLVTRRGGEHVLEALAELFPSADIFTLVSGSRHAVPALKDRKVYSSILQKFPGASRWYPYFLPLFPAAVSRIDLRGYDLIISSDAAVVKGVRTDAGAIHICYCHTPMRYVWTGYETYYRAAAPAHRFGLYLVREWLRRWDYEAAQRVTHFVANSLNVQKRIWDCYRRGSSVIYPPVDTEGFVPDMANEPGEPFFLLVSQLVPYKRADIVVDAFNKCGKRLVVIGDGPDKQRLLRVARPNIQILGAQPRGDVVKAMQQCRAFVFAGEEDFGIVMAEAQACGKPVIAFGAGGACEIVQSGITGVLFEEQSVRSLLDAIERFESFHFDTSVITSSVGRFGRRRFLREFSGLLEETLPKSMATSCSTLAPYALNTV